MKARQKGKQSEKFQFIFKLEKECRKLMISQFETKILEKLRTSDGHV